MKAVIEEDSGLYLIRIYKKDGYLCDVFVVEKVAINQTANFMDLNTGEVFK